MACQAGCVALGAGSGFGSGCGSIAVTALILIVEVIKFARIGTRSFVDHALALLLFFGMTAEFVWVAQAATATFFLMLVIAFVEAAGGIGVSLRARARPNIICSTAPRPRKAT